MKKQFLFNLVLGVSWILAALALAHRVYSLRFDQPPNAILFWLPYIVLISISAYISLTRHDKIPIIVTLGLAFVLHSVNVLRQPGNILWGKDAVHDLQIAEKGLAAGHFVFGDPTFFSHSFDQSFYPGLELLMSSLSLVTKIPLPTLYNFTFVPLNLLTLFFFYFLVRMLFKSPRIINVSILLYTLAPPFNGFNSFAVHESLAIIFFPLVIAALLSENSETFRHRGMLVSIVLAAIVITITNEFTMYVLTFSAFVIVTTYFISERRQKTKLMLLLLLVTLLFVWLLRIAVFFIQRHGGLIEHIINSLVSTYETKVAPVSEYSLPFLEWFFSYLGFGLLFIMSVIGIYSIVRRTREGTVDNAKKHVLVTWWILSLGITVLFQVIPWERFGEGPMRLRSLEFSYFGIAPFAALGIEIMTMLKSKHLMNAMKWKQITKIASLMIIAIIAVPTICVGFSTHFYDSKYKAISLNSVEAFFSSAWLSQYSVSTRVAGTKDGQTWVSGYASKIFLYEDFKKSIQTPIQNQTREILADTYYINLANIRIRDDTNFAIGMDNLLWLESRLSKAYDNGGIIILIADNQSRTP